MNAIAEFITSFRATVLGLIIFLLYRYIEMVSLFHRYLPLEGLSKDIGAYLVSFVVVFSLLIFSSNLEKFKVSRYGSGAWIKWVLFLFTLVINAYFWEVWNGGIQSTGAGLQLTILFKIVIVIFFAIFDFSYNEIFIKSWLDKKALSQVSSSLSKLKKNETDLLAKESKLQARITGLSAKLSQLIAKQDPKICERCGKEHSTYQAKNAHMRTCKIKIEDL